MCVVQQLGAEEGTPDGRGSAQVGQVPFATSGKTCGATMEKERALLSSLQATKSASLNLYFSLSASAIFPLPCAVLYHQLSYL